MRVVVLGASGFLGRHLVPLLLDAGHEVVAVARHPPGAHPGLTPVPGDAVERPVLERALAGAQGCVNLVGIHHGHRTQSFERIHVELAANLVAAMQSLGVRRLVHLSVLCARPDPKLRYHASKFEGDARIQESGLDWTILRPSIVFGADDAFTTRIQQQLRTRVAPIPGSGDALQAPVHVDDLAQAIVRALARPEAVRQVLPLTGLRTLTYRQLVAELADRGGQGAWMPSIPLGFLKAVAAMSGWLANPPISAGQLAMIAEGMAGDTKASWSMLGIEPRGFSAAHLR